MNQQIKIPQLNMGHIFILPDPGADGLIDLSDQPVARFPSEQAVKNAETFYFQADKGVLLRILSAYLLIPFLHPQFIIQTRHCFILCFPKLRNISILTFFYSLSNVH